MYGLNSTFTVKTMERFSPYILKAFLLPKIPKGEEYEGYAKTDAEKASDYTVIMIYMKENEST